MCVEAGVGFHILLFFERNYMAACDAIRCVANGINIVVIGIEKERRIERLSDR